jgi:hypothetical protein
VKLAGESVDAALERQLAASGVSGAKVECPDPVKVETGSTVTCPVQGVGGVGRVRFEFSDSSGAIDESSVETGS